LTIIYEDDDICAWEYLLAGIANKDDSDGPNKMYDAGIFCNIPCYSFEGFLGDYDNVSCYYQIVFADEEKFGYNPIDLTEHKQ